MNGFDINTASIGYDESGVSNIVNEINTKLIEESINTLSKNIPTLEQNLYSYWKGNAADRFIDKLYSDTNTVLSSLAQLENGINDNFYQMMYNSANSDEAIASEILGLGYSSSNEGGFGKPATVPTTTLSRSGKAASEPSSNVLERGAATVATGVSGLLEGLGKFGEAIVDTAAILETAFATPYTALIDGYGYLGSLITGNDYDFITDDMWNGTMSFVAKDHVGSAFDSFYDNTSVGQWAKTNAYAYDTVRGVASGVGYTTGVVLLSVATMGVGGAAVGAGSAGTATMATTMAGVGGAAGFGKGAETAWGSGASLGEGLAYATANGVWEGAQFYVGGEINNFSPFAKEGLNVATRIGLDAVDSGVEGLVQPALQTIYSDKSYGELFDEAGGWSNVGTQAAMGGAMSGVGEASGLARAFRENKAKLNTTNGILDKIGFLKKSEDNVSYKTSGRVDPSVNHISLEQQNGLINSINNQIKTRGSCEVMVYSSKELNSAVIDGVSDPSKLKVRILGGFADDTGNIKQKYNNPDYIKRVTYTGTEASGILKKLEFMESKIDKSLPLTERAYQVYKVLSDEISPMFDYTKYPNGHDVVGSLRGLTDNNSIGKQGLVCAGYSQAYKELCDRVGIECEYVRGRGISFDDKGNITGSGNHAWNVVKGTNGELIPIDCTWKACGKEGTWFGGGNDFAMSHKADANERYTSYSQPLSKPVNLNRVGINMNETSYNKMNSVSSTLQNKYGSSEANTRLLRYAATNNENIITRTDNARDIVSSIPMSDVKQYLNTVDRTQLVTDGVDYMKRIMTEKYGSTQAQIQINGYLDTGNADCISHDQDARAIAQLFNQSDLQLYKNSHGGAYGNN